MTVIKSLEEGIKAMLKWLSLMTVYEKSKRRSSLFYHDQNGKEKYMGRVRGEMERNNLWKHWLNVSTPIF